MNNDPVPTADARMKLAEPQNFFTGYPDLTFEFFKILLDRMPDHTTPIDFLMRFEESLEDVKAQPQRFGHAGIFVWAMRLNTVKIATELFGTEFGDVIEEIADRGKGQD